MNKQNGSALIIVLMAAVLLAGVAGVALSFCGQAGAETDAAARRFRLRGEAVSAALRGFAGLQSAAGPDARHTFKPRFGSLRVGHGAAECELDGEVMVGEVRWRWAVTDLSALRDRAAGTQAALGASGWALGAAARPKLPRALPAAPTPAQLRALAAGTPDFFGVAAGAGETWQTRGLLTDSVRGGWRTDLSDPGVQAGLFGPELAGVFSSEPWRRPPARGLPIARCESDGRLLSTVPMIADLRLSLGFFNSRHDGRHRLRFHGSGVLWNPTVVPVLAGPQGKVFLVEINGAPEVAVTNLETGAGFVADLDECPQADFGAVRQGPRERGLWFWAEVADPPGQGMTGRGLLPGEAYAFVSPSAETQPQGLARILSTQTWRMDKGAPATGARRPSGDVFRPTDRIEIVGRFRRPLTVRLRGYAGEPSREAPIADYPGPVFHVWENVRCPDFLIHTTGADYSREDSSGYHIGERRACLRLRLRPRTWEDFAEAAGSGRLLRGRWDLSRGEDADEWRVEPPVLSALDVVDHDASALAGPLWDLRPNRHDAAEPGAFASWRLRDLPTWPMLSVGAWRHLEPAGGTRWMQALDRHFHSATPTLSEPGAASHQPFYLLADPEAFAPAARWRVLGPWNVNASDPRAWEAFLGDATGVWRAEAGGPVTGEGVSGAWFFSRPSGAGQPAWGALTSFDLGDSSVAFLSETAGAAQRANQSARCLSPVQLRAWAESIVSLQSECGWPFPSLEAFARSPLLGRSIEAAGLNDLLAGSPAGLPMRLEAADLIEAWAPVLTVRGDTFKVVGRAEGLGGSAVCELLVQREPTEHAPAFLGRRFRIISVRFRNP